MNRRLLFLVIAISGAMTLLMEVSAIRLLAPYFGNSIYVLASVLAVVLGFLALGYWLGGIRAERGHPQRTLFASILAAGVSGLLIATLMGTVMPILGPILPLTWGPLVASLILFALPSTFLGMVTPAAVRLHPLAASVPAQASGEILAISTIGSIAGSLLGGFLILPSLGLRRTVLGMALTLTAMGVLGLGHPASKKERRLFTSVIVLLVPSLFISWTWFLPGLIAEATTPYQHVLVIDVPLFHGAEEPTRILLADLAPMSGQDPQTGEPDFPYARSILSLLERLPTIHKAAFLGGGAFTLPRILHNERPETVIDAVDIDGKLVDIAKEYFLLRPDDRLRIHATDGRRFLRDTAETYDVVVLDMYQSIATPAHVMTKEFFDLLRTRLTDDGVVLMNVIGEPIAARPSLPLAIAASAQHALPYQTLLTPEPVVTGVGNYILIASPNAHPLHERVPVVAGRRVDMPKEALRSADIFTDDQLQTVRYEAAIARAIR